VPHVTGPVAIDLPAGGSGYLARRLLGPVLHLGLVARRFRHPAAQVDHGGGGHRADPGDFIQPLASRPGAGRIAAWTWRSVPEPALGSLTPGAREWEMTRYRAYQARLAGQPVGATFRRATAFLRLAAEGSSLSRT
jgi:hypothetical protein